MEPKSINIAGATSWLSPTVPYGKDLDNGDGWITDQFRQKMTRLAQEGIIDAATAARLIDEADEFCFAPDTLVSTEHGKKPISKIEPGENVYSFNYDSGEWELAKVLKRSDNHYSGEMVTLEVDGNAIEVTANHPFWVSSGPELASREQSDHAGLKGDEGKALEGRWVDSHCLVPSDKLVSDDGIERTVGKVEIVEVVDQNVCNLTVEGLHTFAVGKHGILVHNTSWCDIMLTKFPQIFKKVPKPLQDLLEKAIKETGKLLKVHGHHIVQKSGGGVDAQTARELMAHLDIPLLGTQPQLRAADAKDLHNMALAINSYKEIHSRAYDKAVLDRLLKATGKTADQLKKLNKNGKAWKTAQKAMQGEFKKIKRDFHNGKIFWPQKK